jgi:hypothetical protein
MAGDETSCKYCKHKNTFKQVTEKNEHGESDWQCKKTSYSTVTVYPGKPLEDVLNDVCTLAHGCRANFEHYQTGKNYEEEWEYPSKWHGRKVRYNGQMIDIEEWRKKGCSRLDTNYS